MTAPQPPPYCAKTSLGIIQVLNEVMCTDPFLIFEIIEDERSGGAVLSVRIPDQDNMIPDPLHPPFCGDRLAKVTGIAMKDLLVARPRFAFTFISHLPKDFPAAFKLWKELQT